MEPKSDYQKMLHDNYHIAKKFGPAPNCPYCPRKESIWSPSCGFSFQITVFSSLVSGPLLSVSHAPVLHSFDRTLYIFG